MDAKTFVRFMRHVSVPIEKGGCWIWTGNKPDGRYGHFSDGGEVFKAHRVMFEHFNGPVKGEQVVRHRCDTPACVCPTHLEIGTAKDNTADCISRGRRANRQGERHPLAKISSRDVDAIRAAWANGRTQKSIAEAYYISRQHVGKIVRGESWSHL